MQEPLERKSFDEKALKMHRLIQIVTLLPLTMITALMLYFKEASEFGVLAFFFLLVLGVSAFEGFPFNRGGKAVGN